MDDDLEVGIAAGLDVPTAIALAADDKPQPPRKGRGCGVLAVAVPAVMALWWLLR
jgi:hypothetical protein